MNDKEFLQWLHDRLIEFYHVPSDVDYMRKLRSIIEVTDPDQLTANTK